MVARKFGELVSERICRFDSCHPRCANNKDTRIAVLSIRVMKRRSFKHHSPHTNMTRAEITDRGLSRRLGEHVSLSKTPEGKPWEGRLVYFPKGYAVQTPRSGLIPIRRGYVVGLHRGQGISGHEEHTVHYKYVGS